MAGLRIRIQLPDENKVEHKYWLLVNTASSKTIRDVSEDIDKKFKINCDHLTFLDAELPFHESVDILRDEDLIVSVFYD